jgi:hypothetical protein
MTPEQAIEYSWRPLTSRDDLKSGVAAPRQWTPGPSGLGSSLRDVHAIREGLAEAWTLQRRRRMLLHRLPAHVALSTATCRGVRTGEGSKDQVWLIVGNTQRLVRFIRSAFHPEPVG